MTPSPSAADAWLNGPQGRLVNAAAHKVRRTLGALLMAAMLSAPAATAQAQSEPIRLLAFGDSLVAGFGLASSNAFPAKLEVALRQAGYLVEVMDAGVSGDTTAGGAARIDWTLGDDPDLALVELGANDALRGIDPEVARDNLDYILQRLRDENVPVLLAGMYAPANWGPEYVRAFNRIYPDLAEEYGVLLYPFFLDGVATDPSLNLEDGIHPNARGVTVIVERILPYVVRLIDESGLAPDASPSGLDSE